MPHLAFFSPERRRDDSRFTSPFPPQSTTVSWLPSETRFPVAAFAVALLLVIFSGTGLGDAGRQLEDGSFGARAIDLLPLVVPGRDRIAGDVVKAAGKLSIASRWSIGAARLPYLPSAEYDLELELSRISGRDGIGIVLPVAGRQEVALVLGGYPREGGLDGLNYVDGKNLVSNGTSIKSCLRNNETINVMVQVRVNAISYYYDCGSTTIGESYNIEGHDLSIDRLANDIEQRSLALYQVKGESEFTKIVVTDFGEGRELVNSSRE
jgi:hypothetical protein